MKETVGIVTITELLNYGNRLQNYAMQEFLKELGYDSETINQYSNNILKMIAKRTIYAIGKIIPFNSHIINIYSRQMRFENFNRQFIKFAKHSLEDKNLKFKALKYKFVVCGSDQIWNPYFNCGKDDKSFLTFVDEGKRIALCASFGCEKLPKEQEERYFRLISGIKNISVREDNGKKIIEYLIPQKNIQVFLDPVFWISSKKWDKLASYSNINIENNYILVSYVDRKRKKKKEKIEKFAIESGLKIIYLQDIENKETYMYDPCDFLYLIKNAEFILTDSFHATAFSIIYQKPFFVLAGRNNSNNNMDSRLDTLLKRFSLSSRKIEDESKMLDISLRYPDISKIINYNKIQVIKFLKGACS